MIETLIVGAFKRRLNGATGGVLFACTSLIESDLSKNVKWIKIDSTAKIPIEHISIRGVKAFFRVVKLLFFMIFRPKIKYVILFVSDGPSLFEKGLMCIISKTFAKTVLFAPRSGNLPSQFKNRCFRKFGVFLFKISDYVICQGYEWKVYFTDLCNNKCSPDKFVVIHNWIDTNEYPKKPIKSIKPHSKIILLFLGWTIRSKGIFDLIDAVNFIKEQTPDLLVVIGGDGADRVAAENLVKKLNLTKFFDFRGWIFPNEKINLLHGANIFILPSYAEGFPNSVLEAMACGLPVIVSRVGAVTELVKEESGILVNAGNHVELADAILKYYNDKELRISHGFNGYNLVRENFSINYAVDKFKQLLS